MTIFDKINEYCIENSTKFNIPPSKFNCILLPNEKINIKASWSTGESKNKIIESSNKESFEINKSEDIYNILHPKLSQLKSNINISNNGTINDVSFCNVKKFNNSESISRINVTVTKSIFKSIINTIHNELTSIEPNIEKEQIAEVKCFFKNSNLQGIEGYVVTENPHKYNKNMDSLDDYISINSHKKPKEKLQKQDNYLAHFMIDNKIENNIESIMKEQIQNNITVSGQHMFEFESIIVYNNTSHPEYKSEESKTSKLNFSIIQPV